MANIDLCNNCPAFQPKLECINVPKIFDQCRIQVCLTPNEIGSAKPDLNSSNCCTAPKPNCQPAPQPRNSCTNDNLVPPANAVSVSAEDFCIKSMTVLNKSKSAFRQGFFDISIRFVFSYVLRFFNCDNMEISRVPATSSYSTTVSLYGGENICVATFNELYNRITANGPFISIEASAMNLSANLRYPCNPCNNICNFNCGCNCGCGCSNNCGCCDCEPCQSVVSPSAVDVTIGLFAVIKLLRLSNMSVNSYGNCMPCECSDVSDSVSPCEFFDSLSFPTNLFAPQTNYSPCCDVSANTPTNGHCCDNC